MEEKFIIYQLLPRLFGNSNEHCVPDGSLSQNGSGKFSDISDSVLDELKKTLSLKYIWYTGIIRHATQGDESVKGKAGSPYAIKDYYDVNPYLADNPEKRMDEFKALLDRTHENGLGVLIDFVPNHVSRSYNSKNHPFTDLNYYPGKIHDTDWSDTVKINYASDDTWQKMKNILLFWASMGVDGFRCDMVELVPTSFWSWCIPEIKTAYPNIIFIAEIYQTNNYHTFIDVCHFDYLYDKSGFYDHLRSIYCGGGSAASLTHVWQSLGELQPKMLNFLENHDEQRIASDFYTASPFKSLSALNVSLFFNTAPFMIYFGQEFSERGMDQEGFSTIDGRTSIYDFWSVSSIRRWLKGVKIGDPDKYLSTEEIAFHNSFSDMMRSAVSIEAIRKGKTYDLEYVNLHSTFFDPEKHFAFLRYFDGELFLSVSNFSDNDSTIKVTIPKEAFDYFGIIDEEYISSHSSIELFVRSFDGILIKIK
jgi:glycosidase